MPEFLQQILGELKRRRVFRVAGVYLVVAWLVIQVADTVFPAMGLPDWTLRLVILLAALGFPVVVALGWVFDVTPEGVERTIARRPAAVEGAVGTRPRRVIRRGMWFALGILVAGSGAWIAVQNRGNAAALDANMVAVLPFRVSGDPSLDYLRDGMLDLLAATLTGEGGPRSSDPRSLLAAWKRAVPTAGEDLPEDAAVDFARGLGAGNVLLGGIVGNPSQFTMTAKVLSVPGGRVRAEASEAGSEAELMQIVERLSVTLLTQLAGDADVDRVNSLAGVPLPLLREYLAGRVAYRLGHYQEAIGHFRAVLTEDSSFALAALELSEALGWADGEQGAAQARAETDSLAFAARDRLSLRDQKLLMARLGPNYPDTSSASELLKAAQEATAAAPDRPEAWYTLGDFIFHSYGTEDPENYRATAQRALERAVALDSSFIGPITHLAELYSYAGDRDKLRTITEVALRADSAGESAPYMRWHHARVTGNEAERARARASFVDMRRTILSWVMRQGLHQPWDSADVNDAVLVRAELTRRAVSKEERRASILSQANLAMTMGRPREAAAFVKATGEPESNFSRSMLSWYLTYSDMPAGFEQGMREVERLAEAPQPSDEEGRIRQYQAIATVELWRLLQGRTETTEAAIGRLERLKGAVPETTGRAPISALLIAMRASAQNAPDALQRAREYEQLRAEQNFVGWWALLSAQMLAQHGDLDAARKTLGTLMFPSGILERARILARQGRTDAAIREYQIYLLQRHSPEPEARANVDKVRAELAALVGEK